MSVSSDTLAMLDMLEQGVEAAKYRNKELELQNTNESLDMALRKYVECRDTIPDDPLWDSVTGKLTHLLDERREKAKNKMEEMKV